MQRHSSTRAGTNDLSYLLKNIKLNPKNDIDDEKMLLKKIAFEKLVQEKKLSLVLDLDHTLVHTVKIKRLTPEDQDFVLKETYDPSLMSSLFRIKFNEKHDYVVKLRPGLRQFLERASKMFKLFVFTKGARAYAMEILKLIDPEDYYFGCKSSSSSRIFTLESCVLGNKSLDLVMGKESGILIVDDKISAWRDVDKKNVLEIPQYDFFKLGSYGKRLSGGVLEGNDESENEGWLMKYFRVLKAIHALFFYSQRERHVLERDVRVLKKELVHEFGTLNVVGLAAMISSVVR